jgi:hypothetical protein
MWYIHGFFIVCAVVVGLTWDEKISWTDKIVLILFLGFAWPVVLVLALFLYIGLRYDKR